MNLHEYQAKSIFRNHGIPVPEGIQVADPQQTREAAAALGGDRWVVKAQVHAGGRGKAGGVVLTDSVEQTVAEAERLLGSELKTKQTGDSGLPINRLLIEKPTGIARELYMSALVDRAARRIAFMVSSAGGMNIEEVAKTDPDRVIREAIDPAVGLMSFQCRKIAANIGLQGRQIGEAAKLMKALYRCFRDKDALLAEIADHWPVQRLQWFTRNFYAASLLDSDIVITSISTSTCCAVEPWDKSTARSYKLAMPTTARTRMTVISWTRVIELCPLKYRISMVHMSQQALLWAFA